MHAIDSSALQHTACYSIENLGLGATSPRLGKNYPPVRRPPFHPSGALGRFKMKACSSSPNRVVWRLNLHEQFWDKRETCCEENFCAGCTAVSISPPFGTTGKQFAGHLQPRPRVSAQAIMDGARVTASHVETKGIDSEPVL